MCVVSNIGNGWKDNFPKSYPVISSYFSSSELNNIINEINKLSGENILLKNEIEKLKKEMIELRKLLKAAKKYDEKTGQKDCEMDDKIKFIKKIAELVGVDYEKVFK